jgi:hypothetical protein
MHSQRHSTLGEKNLSFCYLQFWGGVPKWNVFQIGARLRFKRSYQPSAFSQTQGGTWSGERGRRAENQKLIADS